MLQWREKGKIQKELGKLNTIGHDIWYTKPKNISYNKLKGKLTSLNMAGWGEMIDRIGMWKKLAYNKTMIMVLIDHKIMEKGRVNMENEIELEWT